MEILAKNIGNTVCLSGWRTCRHGARGWRVAVAAAIAGTLLTASISMADPVATYNYGMSSFVQDGTTIYAAVPSENSIAVINASTLQATLVGIGSNPQGLAISQDGKTLYVADQGSNFIGVLNTQTNQVGTPIPLGPGVNPLDVQVGSNGRLWVLTGAQNQFGSIEQISASTGASTGSGVSAFIYGGQIQTTSDGNTLYYADFGTSPAYEYQVNVSGAAPTVTWTTSQGSNGTGLALSNDGTLVSFPQGGNASNGVIQTSSHLTLGSVQAATSMAFSPNDSLAYTAISFIQGIRGFSLTTYLDTVNISTVGDPQSLFVDNSGQYIFSNEVGVTRVYQTGAVPEPAPIFLLLSGIAWACFRWKRKPSP